MVMGNMLNTFKSAKSIECCESSKQKVDYQGSSPILRSQNVNNRDVTEMLDKFNGLPESLIHHVLSYMETKDAIRTCVLSKRWRYFWTSIPCLCFNSESFPQLADFKRFVLWVLSQREASNVKTLIYYRFGVDNATDENLLAKVIEYAASNNVEEIRINLRERTSYSAASESPLSLFYCQTLKKFKLNGFHCLNFSSPLGCKSLKMLKLVHLFSYPVAIDYSNPVASLPEVFCLTTLTTLHLNSFTLCYTGNDHLGPFVSCVNLKNLHLSDMSFKSDMNPKADFVISASKLNNLTKLTLICNHFKSKVVVSAPQLTNFSYIYSAPSIVFEFGIPSLDGMVIDILEPHGQWEKACKKQRKENSHGLISMFRGHQNVEAFELTLCTIKATNETAARKKKKSFSFTKMKSLNLRVGLTYKIFIQNRDNITAYFRNCSQDGDFDVLIV